jgi:hypothetical protein
MLSGRSRVGAAALLAAGLTGGYLASGAVGAGSGMPANKATAAASTLAVVAPGSNVTLLSATMKTSKPTDLILQTTLECSILTELLTNNTDMSSTAGARVRAWIEIDDVVVPLEQISSPPQDGTTPPAGDPVKDGAVFCDREYSRTVANDETTNDGVDSQSDYIKTKSTHGFNWLKMNVGSGIHRIELVATLTTAVDDANAKAEAIVGNRTLIIEPTKMANDAVIAQDGSS